MKSTFLTVTTERNLECMGSMVESQRHDPSRGARADWPREILKTTGTLERRFSAICICGERCPPVPRFVSKKLYGMMP